MGPLQTYLSLYQFLFPYHPMRTFNLQYKAMFLICSKQQDVVLVLPCCWISLLRPMCVWISGCCRIKTNISQQRKNYSSESGSSLSISDSRSHNSHNQQVLLLSTGNLSGNCGSISAHLDVSNSSSFPYDPSSSILHQGLDSVKSDISNYSKNNVLHIRTLADIYWGTIPYPILPSESDFESRAMLARAQHGNPRCSILPIEPRTYKAAIKSAYAAH